MEHRNIFGPWAEKVEEATDGMVKIEWYLAMALGPPPGTFERIVSGITDIGFSTPSYTPGPFPLTSIAEVPFLGYPYVGGAEIASRVINELDQKFPEMMAEFAEVHMLWHANTSPAGFHTLKSGFRTLEDFNGQLIRAAGKAPSRTIELLGGTAVPMPVPDVYLAMEKGTVDCLNMSVGIFRPYKLFEVLQYHTLIPTNVIAMAVTMNLDTWNALPADTQAKIDEISADWWQVHGKSFDAESAWVLNHIEEIGQEIIYPSDGQMQRIVDATRVQWDEWVAEMEAKGLPGQAILDEAVRLAEEYK